MNGLATWSPAPFLNVIAVERGKRQTAYTLRLGDDRAETRRIGRSISARD
jgi:hypothetical protein